MSGDEEWRGGAGREVVKRIYALERASGAVDQARRDLIAAQDAHKAAEQDLDTAKSVYHAGQQDLARLIRAPKVTPQKRDWLKQLNGYEVFGAAEMLDAARDVGWLAKPGALRTISHDYRKAGYFISVGHGAMRLNRSRLEEALGRIFHIAGSSSESIIEQPDDNDNEIRDIDGTDRAKIVSSINAQPSVDISNNVPGKIADKDQAYADYDSRVLFDDDLPF